MKLYNSLTKRIEKFKPFNPHKVSLYVCGITPYDTTHLGHAFTYTMFDVLVRYLRFLKFKVKYVQNVTDIDDDILKRAKRDNRNWKELGDFWTNQFLNDLKSLNILLPDVYCRATDSITLIIYIVKTLIKKGMAYEKKGNVYFEVKKYKNYGQLSKYNYNEMLNLSRERGADPNDENKKNPLDFLLWQKSKVNEPFWQSPWGKGRPGWHIECSAMINQYLGKQIDLHGGGHDLIYPHHESEIAQSESYTGKFPFVKYWLHTAMVQYQGEKMSKSLGNLIMISDLLKKYSSNTIRLLLLSNHYRKPWEYTQEKMEHAQKNMFLINQAINKQAIRMKKTNLSEFMKLMDNDLRTDYVVSYLVNLSQKKELAKLLFCLYILGFK